MNMKKEDLNAHDIGHIKKRCLEAGKSWFGRDKSIFEVRSDILILQKMGLKNVDIAEKMGIKEDTLYYVIPIDHASKKTKEMISEKRMDGYKAARLLRHIGADKRQDDWMDEIVSNNMSLPKAEEYLSKQRHMDDKKWVKVQLQKEFEQWIKTGKAILLKNSQVELSNGFRTDLKLLNARISVLLGKKI